MQLTAKSSPGEVLMYHPKREHFDEIVINPRKTWFGAAGPWAHVLGAQDRVLLRRHIREFFPDVAAICKIEELGECQLASLINIARLDS